MISINYSTIYDNVFELASFEAGRGMQEESLYPQLMVNTRDKDFVQTHADAAFNRIIGLLDFCIASADKQEANYVIVFREDCAYSMSTEEWRLTSYVTEALTAYAMERWLDNKLSDRAQVYAKLFEEMTGMLVKRARRRKPNKPI